MTLERLQEIYTQLRADCFAKELLAGFLLPNCDIDSSAPEHDQLFRTLVLDEGYGVATARAVYATTTSLCDA
jgi:hypothetical protein